MTGRFSLFRSIVWSDLRRVLEQRQRVLAPRLTRVLNDHPGRWLDVGCGDGWVAGLADPSRYLGIDRNPFHLDLARRRHPLHSFARCDFTGAPAGLGRFSGALILNVLHHMADDEVGCLAAWLRAILDPDHRVVIVDPIPSGPGDPLSHRTLLALESGRAHRGAEDICRLLGGSWPVRGEDSGSAFYRACWIEGSLDSARR